MYFPPNRSVYAAFNHVRVRVLTTIQFISVMSNKWRVDGFRPVCRHLHYVTGDCSQLCAPSRQNKGLVSLKDLFRAHCSPAVVGHLKFISSVIYECGQSLWTIGVFRSARGLAYGYGNSRIGWPKKMIRSCICFRAIDIHGIINNY